MTPQQALALVRKHGVMLASAKGRVPCLADIVAGEPIKGSWWAHPKGREIFRVLGAVGDSPDVLVCRLVDGKITFVHRRLWAALVRCAEHFSKRQLANVRQEHTASGRHVNRETAFPQWVPPDVMKEADHLDRDEALRSLGI